MSGSDEPNLERELFRREMEEVKRKQAEIEADLAAAADESDPEAARAARERLADEHQGGGRL